MCGIESAEKAELPTNGRSKLPRTNQRTVRTITCPLHYVFSPIFIGKQPRCRRAKWAEISYKIVDICQKKIKELISLLIFQIAPILGLEKFSHVRET
jgi:hypothetical protein